ncbi:MAG TPA: hypothetical protein VKV21_14675 [Solirubrobacteraceae bacterium]|nr:hypothetical protein [Solirubrobacteraceae bacterium]
MPSIARRRLRATLGLSAAICGAVALCIAGPSAARAASACTSTSLAQADSAGSCWTPFAGAPVFNTRLSTDPPLAPDNAAVQDHMVKYGWTIGWDPHQFSIGPGSRPVFYGTPSDPVMTIHCTSSEGPGTCQGQNGTDINGVRINVPAGARPDGNGDAHMTIIETANGDEYDLWHASVSGSTITAGTGAETNVGTGTGTGSGGDAANLALSAGLLRPSELMSGHIDHALVIVVPCTDATGFHVGYTWPATGGWGQACGQGVAEDPSTAPELGQLLRLDMTPAQIAASGAPAWEQTIMTALADYGAYIEDTGGLARQMSLIAESPSSWTDLGRPDQWAEAARMFGEHGDTLTSDVPIPTGDLQVVDTCVTRGTCPDNGNPVAHAASAHARRHGRHVRRHARHDRRHARRRHRHERGAVARLSRWRVVVGRRA